MTTDSKSNAKAFVEMIIKRIGGDKAFGAAMRRADNPVTERHSWDYLAQWCDLEKIDKSRAYALIGAAVAKAKPVQNGSLGIGRAIAQCYADEGRSNGNEKDAAKIKLRRLLACKTTKEACGILRPLLSLIKSRNIHLDYAKLLQELQYNDEAFNDWIKRRWAMDFYNKKETEE
ncbi:type I-E CRISPR-associated protein Cse2/CasB [Treponema primitia]|uniref:type I-E CRISPR-associated protein Cse2/CasB n=1 Tax=Treponema primitia TaxID=88058 RepID=UPI0002554C53|nr:type I-E CRISPR-associated protein Cse2/CasB [Treponema primitia]